MEKAIKKVVHSEFFFKDLQEIYVYGIATFGQRAADAFIEDLFNQVSDLNFLYDVYPECRHLKQKKELIEILSLDLIW